MNWNAVQKSLRQFAGINLDKNRKIPSNWVVVKEEMVIGDNSTFIVRMAVFPETFTGFSKGIGQQNKSVGKNLGIEIEVEDMGTGEYGSDRTFSDISFDRQNEFFKKIFGSQWIDYPCPAHIHSGVRILLGKGQHIFIIGISDMEKDKFCIR